MASNTDMLAPGPLTAPDRPIPLVTLRQPTLGASSSISLNSSTPTTPPSTPASLTPPTSAHGSSPTITPERLSRQTTCVSAVSVAPPDGLSPPPSQPSLTIPRSIPDEPEPPRPQQRQATWISLMPPWDHRRTWVQNTIGLAALAVALVGMFVYALRGYKLAKWTARNDLLQSCATLIQANRSINSLCKKILDEGPRERPFYKRSFNEIARRQGQRLKDKIIGWNDGIFEITPGYNPTGVWGNKPVNDRNSHSSRVIWMGCIVAFGIGVVLLLYLRQPSRTETVFQSPARSEGSVRIIHDHPEGPVVDEPRGPIEIRRRQPSTSLLVRHRLKQKAHDKKTDIKSKISWRPGSLSANSSAVTLVGEEDDQSKEHDEHHDGLIELKQSNGTRNFFDPDTGETLHLAPWKSTHDSSEEEDEEHLDHLEKGTIQRKLTEMSIGSAMFVGGNAAETAIHEQAQAEKKKQSQQMGDSLAGLVSSEPASIKEAFK
ncbi:hypothetical protein G7Y79_00072g097770 [Physcia stellaris]|nr:hypothetical protein G7Y79_00072g097770 [Physcia stellaris]